MRLSSLTSLFAIAFAATAFAQTPVLQAGDRPEAAEARTQLKAVLACKPGTKIDAKVIEAHFAALGLVKGAGGIFFPARDARVTVFGAEAVAAAVWIAQGEKKASVYLRGQKADPLAKKLGASKVDKDADTNDRSYFKQTSKTTTVLVGAAADLDAGASFLKYESAVTCQLLTSAS